MRFLYATWDYDLQASSAEYTASRGVELNKPSLKCNTTLYSYGILGTASCLSQFEVFETFSSCWSNHSVPDASRASSSLSSTLMAHCTIKSSIMHQDSCRYCVLLICLTSTLRPALKIYSPDRGTYLGLNLEAHHVNQQFILEALEVQSFTQIQHLLSRSSSLPLDLPQLLVLTHRTEQVALYSRDGATARSFHRCG